MTLPTAILGFAWNPAIGLPEAVALALVFLAAGLWLAHRGLAGAFPPVRWWMFASRGGGVVLLAGLWMNPGHWIEDARGAPRTWLVLLDRSASMKAEQRKGATRWETGVGIAAELAKGATELNQIRLRTFSAQLEDETAEPAKLAPDGAATDLGRAVASALDQRASPLAGLVVISDGRETVRGKLDEIGLRARGLGIPIHTVALGGSWGARDLALTASPRRILSFGGQPVKIAARLENHGLGAIKPTVVLLGPDGKELARKDAALADGAHETLSFDLPASPTSGGEYTVRTAPWPGEHLLSNNSDSVRVHILPSKIRILLLEGAPYWDSKFLAQLLRQQNAIDVLTVHRLNEERYFRVEADGAKPLASPDAVFPDSSRELKRYDLIVFGKGAEGFLTPARLAALQGFVRDQGGAVLFARGKPYAGRFPGLEEMESIEWGDSLGGGFRFRPLQDASAGLFGSVLPDAEDRIWLTLTPLEDVHSVARLRPFARVLAEGAIEGRETRIPLLIARRLGRGVVAAINGDGLWRWDFRPELREQGAVYQQFWVQLLQWCATWSEFRPGEDYAVRLREAEVEPGQPVRAVISYRGAGAQEPKPRLRIVRDGQPAGEAVPTPLSTEEDGRSWVALFTADRPGRYEFHVIEEAHPERPQGEAVLAVPAPLAEGDDLRPDPESLAALSRESGGRRFAPEETSALASALAPALPSASAKPRWEPLWPRLWVAALVALAFGSEWWLRRREGLL